MAEKSYLEKLKDPRWQKLRLQVFERDDFSCKECGSTKNTLNVHHIDYKGNNPWETPINLLKTLCESCHEEETDALKKAEKRLIKQLKSIGFMAENINCLSDALFFLKKEYDGNVDVYNVISVFNIIFRNKEVLEKFVEDNYEDSFSEYYDEECNLIINDN